jgi:hypothetical protein
MKIHEAIDGLIETRPQGGRKRTSRCEVNVGDGGERKKEGNGNVPRFEQR